MNTTGKHLDLQMHLWDGGECSRDGLAVTGKDVYLSGSGKVSTQWLSRCEEERALTVGLMEKIADPLNLSAALRQVVSNGGSAGIDGMSVKGLQVWFSTNYDRLSTALKSGTYHPEVVRGVQIPKPKGGYRQLGIPTARDRLVQQAIHQVLIRQYEPTFSENSFGFRPGHNAHQGLHRACEYVKEGYSHVVDLDLEKFFDKVNQDRLLWLLGTRIGDKSVLKLIGKFLRMGILQDGLVSQRVEGMPQGSPLSPLLSNIVLDELDKELEHRGHRFTRYADDLVIFTKSSASAKRVKRGIIGYIESRLHLKVNREKSRTCRPWSLNFLGHSILSDGKLGLSRESEQRFKAKIRTLTRRNSRAVAFYIINWHSLLISFEISLMLFAISVILFFLSRLSAIFFKVDILEGALPEIILDASSLKVTSFIQCKLFSIRQ